ncbi:helix-turn-helix transcriptional regulator [Niabella sp.]|uniref:LuxR C-terminal-related transcriptional regulator n=1 Tax=Niabella sp. TaxID=1962976 RepID=UPI00262CDBE3|nr:helix-turn-helix transcriptional regulator [Niabella sp.]
METRWKVECLSREGVLRITMDIRLEDIALLLATNREQMDQARNFIHTRQPLFDALSMREKEILRLVIGALSNKQVAAKLGIALDTVKTHRKNLMRKLNCNSLKELLVYKVFYTP